MTFSCQIFEKEKFKNGDFDEFIRFEIISIRRNFLKCVLINCDKNWWVARKRLEKQTIKIFKKLNDLFPNLTVTKEGSK